MYKKFGACLNRTGWTQIYTTNQTKRATPISAWFNFGFLLFLPSTSSPPRPHAATRLLPWSHPPRGATPLPGRRRPPGPRLRLLLPRPRRRGGGSRVSSPAPAGSSPPCSGPSPRLPAPAPFHQPRRRTGTRRRPRARRHGTRLLALMARAAMAPPVRTPPTMLGKFAPSGPAATLGAALPHLQLYLNVRAVLHYLHDAYRGSDGDSNGQSSVKSSRILAFRLRNSIFNEIVHWMLGSFMFPPSASAWGTMVVSLLQLLTY